MPRHRDFAPLIMCGFCGGDFEYDEGDYVLGDGHLPDPWQCHDCAATIAFESVRDAFDAAEEEADRRMDEDRSW